jgi:N-acetylglutamate synthase
MNEKIKRSKHGLVLRDFRMEDYDQVIELWRICGLPFRPNGRDSRERIAMEIEKPMALFLVIECEGDVVGTLFGTTDGRKGWINRLAVRPDFRRRGIAKRLIKEMEDRFERLGLGVFSCLIEDHSDSSMRLFEEVGYKEDPSVHYFSKRRNKDS